MSPVTITARPLHQLLGQRLDHIRLDDAIVLGFTGHHQVLVETVVNLTGPSGDLRLTCPRSSKVAESAG